MLEKTRRYRWEYLAFLALAGPNLLLLGIWTVWPFFHSIYLSFTDWNLLSPSWHLVGLRNYLSIFNSALFWQISKNTLFYAVATVGLGVPLSLGIAMLLNQPLLLRNFWRLLFFSPYITASAAIALVWKSILAPDHGPFASAFSLLGARMPDVLGDTTYVVPALILVAIWKNLGFQTVIFLAALQGVNKELQDAAAIDGASSRGVFWHVTLPQISPLTYFLVVVGLIGAIRVFDTVAIMTGGGPANASNMYVYQIYQEAFVYLRMGHASALAMIVFLLIMAITLLQVRLRRHWVYDQ